MTDILLLSWLRANLQLADVHGIIEEGARYEQFLDDARRDMFAKRVSHAYLAGEWGAGIEEDDAERLSYVGVAFSEDSSRQQQMQRLYASSLGIESMSRKEYLMPAHIYSFLDTMIECVCVLNDIEVSCYTCLFLHSAGSKDEMFNPLVSIACASILVATGAELIQAAHTEMALEQAAHNDYLIDRWLAAAVTSANKITGRPKP